MKKIEEVFQKRKEMKAQEEAKELQRANACIKAMPTLFPNDIRVPKSGHIHVSGWNYLKNFSFVRVYV